VTFFPAKLGFRAAATPDFAFRAARTRSQTSATSHTISYPDGTVIGDLLYLVVTTGGPVQPGTITGWTSIAGSATSPGFRHYWRVAESTSGSAVIPTTPSTGSVAVIGAWATPSTPTLDVSANQTNPGGSVNYADAPSVTRTRPGLTLGVWLRSPTTSNLLSVPAGFTTRVFYQPTSTAYTFTIADIQSPAGATGSLRATYDNTTASANRGLTVAF
jgi:hypothetical protein